LLGYFLGENWESWAAMLKKFDLLIGIAIILAAVVIVVRFMTRRRREREVVPDEP
jgi:membrane protein DedA with SNARE-associated domain